MLNLPNSLTVFRIFLIPILVVVLLTRFKGVQYFGWVEEWKEIVAVSIFLVAALTDYLDGYIARRRNQVTKLGVLLDPIADKLLMSAAFISLVELGFAPAWMVVIIIGREFAISGLRSVASSYGVTIPASIWGKYKTVSQIIAVVLLIFTNTLERLGKYGYLGIIALWLVVILAIFSAADYFFKFARQFGFSTKKGKNDH
ncbi:MAG: CDP-diacylglycerol--glycerol-3-phosphate 3-phosphatidyltransferase [Acidobacteriota bacterium]